MPTKIYAQPAVEPISLAEACAHLRLVESSAPSIASGSHAIAAAYSLKGSGVAVSGSTTVLAILESGANATNATVDVKLQESDTDVDGSYVDITDAAFTRITTANDNATYELQVTPTKAYVRAVATVATGACVFGVSIVAVTLTVPERLQLSGLISAARKHCEAFTGRSFVTQTLEYYADSFPDADYLPLPFPPLASVITLKYKDTAGVLQTWDSGNYIVDTVSEPGRVCLAYSMSWPSTYDEAQAVQIQYTAGQSAANVPQNIKQAILLKIGQMYENRGDTEGQFVIDTVERAIESLLMPERIWPI